MQDTHIFDNVRHAIVWATEHLRSKSFPKISRIYISELAKCDDDKKVKEWSGWRGNLPQDAEEAMLLSMQVYRIIKKLDEADQELIILKYWGDYHDKKYLKGALQIKEVMRTRGKHVRLNYRFSVRQIGTIKEMNYRKVHRELLRIEDELMHLLAGKGLVLLENKAPMSQNSISYNRTSPIDVANFKDS